MGKDLGYDSEKVAAGVPKSNMNVSDQITKNKKSTKESTTGSAGSLAALAGLAKLFGNISGNSNIFSRTPSIISQASNNGANTVWANTGSTWKNALANVGQFLGITKNVEDTIPVNFTNSYNDTAVALGQTNAYKNLSDLAKQNVWNNIQSQYNLQNDTFTGGW